MGRGDGHPARLLTRPTRETLPHCERLDLGLRAKSAEKGTTSVTLTVPNGFVRGPHPPKALPTSVRTGS
jgi:hypothetical protein